MKQSQTRLVTIREIGDAQLRIRDHIRKTPVLHVEGVTGEPLWIKAESLQRLGSFKIRGALNGTMSLTAEQRMQGLIALSSGNHAQAVALAGSIYGVPVTILMPDSAPKVKVDSCRALGAELILLPDDHGEWRNQAAARIAESEMNLIHPYNDRAIIAGQGTVGLEIIDQAPEIDTVVVPVSGGGLLAGVSTAVKISDPSIRVVGVEPVIGAHAKQRLEGSLVANPSPSSRSSIADALRAPALGELAFLHIQEFVDEVVSVSEEEIMAGVRSLALNSKLIVEPGGSVAVAAVLAGKVKGGRILAVASGGNIDVEVLSRIIKSV